MLLDVRTSSTTIENALRDTVLFAMGRRMAPVASVAELRAVTTQGQTGDQLDDDRLVQVVQSGVAVAAYRWFSASTQADDGDLWVKPADVTGAGRWGKWTSPIYWSPAVGANSLPLHQVLAGPLQRVIVIDKQMTEDEVVALLNGAVPAVWIEATADNPADLTQDTGHQWDTGFEYQISVITENLRDRREAAQGSPMAGEDPGANALDGLLKALLSGTTLSQVVDGIRNVRIGRGHNWFSDFAERRVVRQRTYTVMATEELPNAANELVQQDEVDAQAQLVQPNAAGEFDADNYLAGGIAVQPGPTLTHYVSAGQAMVGGAPVAYAGEQHAFLPYRDTYRDLLPSGALVFVEATEGGAPPAVTAGAMRIGVTKTYASAVVEDRILAATKQDYGPRYQFPIT